MAGIRSTIDLVITGTTRGLNEAAARARDAARRVAAAEDDVSAARRRSAEAESRVADVEARLAGARAQHTAALSQIGVAETNLQRVRQANQGALSNLGQAEADLARLRASGTATLTEIDDAEQRITRTRVEADQANQNLQRAEAQLERARGRAAQTGGNIAALEERLARARGAAFRASEDLAQSETRLGLLRRRGTDDINRQRSGILGVFDAFGRLADAFSGADGASTSLLAKLAALNSVISSIGGPIVQAVVGILQVIALLGAAGEIIGVVGGVIGQALAGIPALLFAIGAAALTVFLGLDGIKKAAEVLEPAFNKLKTAVSATFEKALTPAFKELAAILPQLTPRFQGIAQALADMARQAIGVITTAHGIGQLNTILAGTANFVRGLSGGVSAFLLGLVDAAAAATPAMAALGTAIGNIFGRIGEVFQRLAANGTIQAAVLGLAKTFDGLGAVIAPVIELLIRMGAALGPTLGQALTDLGATIQTSIPFFEHLAQVAGDLLVTAFNQIGPAIRDVITQLLPGANQGLDGFANTIKTVVIPAIADFIRNIPGMIESIKQFFLAATASALEFASTFLAAISSILGVLHGFFAAMALIPGPMQESFAQAAAATGAFQGKVDELKGSVDGLHDKTVKLQFQTQGAELVKGMQDTIGRVTDKTVKVISSVFGVSENEKLKQAIDNVPSKAITTTSTVLGTTENQLLTAAITAVTDKTTTTLSNVFGEPQNRSLKEAIDEVNSKTVEVRANVGGEDAVRGLAAAINAVHDKVVNIVANVIGNPFGFATGGRVPNQGAFLVGENGPELLTLDGLGGVVTPAAATRQILANRKVAGGAVAVESDSGATPGPMNLEIPIHIGDEVVRVVRAQIDLRDRATKRTVLAGSGVTF